MPVTAEENETYRKFVSEKAQQIGLFDLRQEFSDSAQTSGLVVSEDDGRRNESHNVEDRKQVLHSERQQMHQYNSWLANAQACRSR